MSKQLSLCEAPARNGLEARYREWLHEHWPVFKLYERFALEACERRKQFSISLLTERIRWEVFMGIHKDADGYRINNNYRAYIARDLLQKYPQLYGLLETRRVWVGDETSLEASSLGTEIRGRE